MNLFFSLCFDPLSEPPHINDRPSVFPLADSLRRAFRAVSDNQDIAQELFDFHYNDDNAILNVYYLCTIAEQFLLFHLIDLYRLFSLSLDHHNKHQRL